MYCGICGLQNRDGMRFCNQCGHAFDQPNPSPIIYDQQPVPRQSNVGKWLFAFAMWSAVMILILFGAFLFDNRTRNNSNRSSFTSNPITQYIAQEQRQQISKPSFVVAPVQYMWNSFEVTPQMIEPHVEVSFSASGGGGNDILVYIVDDVGLANVKNKHQAKLYYNSRQVTADKRTVNLSPGRYHIVYDNTFSFFSNKAISADVQLVFKQ